MRSVFLTSTAIAALLASALFAIVPLTAQAQNGAIAVPGAGGPLILPNASGSITRQSSGGTTVQNGVTVFHGTGSTETLTFTSSGGGPGGR